jgi:NADH dehydrogenase
MTVMVTGASGLLGRAIVEALVQRDEVRATVRRPEAGEALRLLGAKVAVRPVEEPDELIEILARVHTIVHLVGGVNQPSDEEILAANHGSTLAAVAAAKEGRVRRLILLSVPGASIDQPHPFLRAKGLAEEAVVNSGLEHAVIRSSHAYGLGGLWFASTVMGAEHGFVVGDGSQRAAPVLAEDVARVVAAIDDRREPIEGVWDLSGPEELTADEVFEIAGEGVPAHLDPSSAAERLSDLLEIPVSVRTTEFFADPFTADAPDPGAPDAATPEAAIPDAATTFGVVTTPFEEGLRAIAARTSRGG